MPSMSSNKSSFVRPLLLLLHLSKTFEVHCDACGDGLGLCFLNKDTLWPMNNESHHLQPQEKSLGIYEKELLVVIHALDAWKHYLLGTPFIICTNHQSIKYL